MNTRRKLSQIPATNMSEVYQTYSGELSAHGLRAYDALAYDKISNSPCKAGRNQSLLQDRYETDTHAGVKIRNPYNNQAVRLVLNGGTHPDVNNRKYLEAHAGPDHLQLATGGNVCGKCGYDQYCTCPKPVWAGGVPVTRKPKPVLVVPVLNGGIWLRGTKIYAILP